MLRALLQQQSRALFTSSHHGVAAAPQTQPQILTPAFSRHCHRQLHHVAIIGSGPAGFYAAQHLLKVLPESRIDIYEKLPVPFGLVRYGVAPDHPEVKNVTHTFTTVLKSPRVRFIGNVEASRDVTFDQFRTAYDAILLSYGASEDRKLSIPGEPELVVSGREFVGWYNGLPENRNLRLNLSKAERAFIIGHGNVALDIARILLSPIDVLRKTDISTYALEELARSKCKSVSIYGRRGPMQVSFTIKELRELIKLQGIQPTFHPEDFQAAGVNDEFIATLPRPKRRLTELMWKTAKESTPTTSTPNGNWSLHFMRSPLKLEKARQGSSIDVTFGLNAYKDSSAASHENGSVTSTGETEVKSCDLVFRSIGYKGRRLFAELPFDEGRGVVPNQRGRVDGVPGVYCCGWVGQGPRGVILSTMQNSFDVANMVAEDLHSHTEESGKSSGPKSGGDSILPSLSALKRVTSYSDFQKIAEYEEKSGTKVTTVEEMLRICGS